MKLFAELEMKRKEREAKEMYERKPTRRRGNRSSRKSQGRKGVAEKLGGNAGWLSGELVKFPGTHKGEEREGADLLPSPKLKMEQ